MKKFIFLGALLSTAKSIPSESKSDSGLVHDELHDTTNPHLEWEHNPQFTQMFLQISPSGEDNVYKVIINRPRDCSALLNKVSGQATYEELQNKGKELLDGKGNGIAPLYFPQKYQFELLTIKIPDFTVTPAGHAKTVYLPIVQVLAAHNIPDSPFLQFLNDTFVEPVTRYGQDYYRCEAIRAHQIRLMVVSILLCGSALFQHQGTITALAGQCRNTARRVVESIYSNAQGFYSRVRGRNDRSQTHQSAALSSHRKTM